MDNREIDSLIAEKVMDLKVLGYARCFRDPESSNYLIGFNGSGLESQPVFLAHCVCEIKEKEDIEIFGHIVSCLEVVLEYSIDISAAWQVIQKMQADGWHYEICASHREPSHYVKFGRGKYDPCDDIFREEHSATGPTPWMAICLAALEAAGVDVDQIG